MVAPMSMYERLSRAYDAFQAGEPSKDAVSLRSMPTGKLAREISQSKQYRKKRIGRNPTSYRMFEPTSIRAALDSANQSGVLGGPFGAASVAEWVRSNPVVHGVTSGLTDFTHLPVGVKHSEEAAAWLEGTPKCRGWRERICDPAELENMAVNRHHAGYCVGLMLWNETKGHPEFQSLDPAGVRYIPSEDRYEYFGWGKVFKIEPENGIWTFDGLLKNAPWREGAWQRLGNDNYGAINAALLEDLWQQAFSIPWVWAVAPQAQSQEQKAKFWNSAIGGAALRVLGVTPGFDMKFLQASAEGKDSFAQTVQRLRENVSIDTWGTIGLIAGGSGFANEKGFREMKEAKITKEARRQSRMENPSIWQPVLDWGVRKGDLSPSARYAIVEYQIETAGAIGEKADAAAKLIACGYSPEEAQRRVGLEKAAMPTAIPDKTQPLPEAREEESEAPPEPSYSEKLAAAMNEHGDAACPHGKHPNCTRCGVVERFEHIDGKPVAKWRAYKRAA